MQTIAEARWWAKEVERNKIFGAFDTPGTERLLKYKNLIIADIFMKLFTITGPLSRYLQAKG